MENRLKMKKYFITGSEGFIGSHLVEKVLKDGNSVYALVNYNSFGSTGWLKVYSSNFKRLKIIFGDIRDPGTYCNYLKKSDYVINLASLISVPYSYLGPKSYIENNILGCHFLYESCKNLKIKKIIHISTSEVYGTPKKLPIKETAIFNPQSPYAASKAAADHLVYSYVRTYKIPAVISNCSNNYGAKQHPEKLIPKLIYNIIHNKELPIYGRGKNSREWLHVKDHCMALFKIFEKGKIGEFYNIGSNKNLNNIQITKALLKIAKNFIYIGNNVKIKYIADRPGHDKRYALNSNKIKKKLNWKPQIKFDDGLKETFLWYLNNKKYYSSLTKRDIVKRLGLKK